MNPCLVCGGTDLEFWAEAEDIEYRTVPDRFVYRRCRACTNLSIDPVPIDRLSKIYPPNYYSFDDLGTSLPQRVKLWLDRRLLAKMCASIPGEELNALDIGGGSGFMIEQLRRAEPRITQGTIVDIDGGAEARARSAGHNFFLGEIEQFPSDQNFDVILMLNLIEHVADPCSILTKARELLRPGGRILVKTPNFDSLDERLFRNSSWGGFHCPRHWVLFTLPSFRRIVSQCGLSVVQARYTQGAPFWSVSVVDLLQRKKLLGRSSAPLFRHPLNGLAMALFAAVDFLRAPFSKTSQMFFVLEKPR